MYLDCRQQLNSQIIKSLKDGRYSSDVNGTLTFLPFEFSRATAKYSFTICPRFKFHKELII